MGVSSSSARVGMLRRSCGRSARSGRRQRWSARPSTCRWPRQSPPLLRRRRTALTARRPAASSQARSPVGPPMLHLGAGEQQARPWERQWQWGLRTGRAGWALAQATQLQPQVDLPPEALAVCPAGAGGAGAERLPPSPEPAEARAAPPAARRGGSVERLATAAKGFFCMGAQRQADRAPHPPAPAGMDSSHVALSSASSPGMKPDHRCEAGTILLKLVAATKQDQQSPDMLWQLLFLSVSLTVLLKPKPVVDLGDVQHWT